MCNYYDELVEECAKYGDFSAVIPEKVGLAKTLRFKAITIGDDISDMRFYRTKKEAIGSIFRLDPWDSLQYSTELGCWVLIVGVD